MGNNNKQKQEQTAVVEPVNTDPVQQDTTATTDEKKEFDPSDLPKPVAVAIEQIAPVEEVPVKVEVLQQPAVSTPVVTSTVVKDTAPVVSGKLPEVLKAYEVAKMQTKPALIAIEEYVVDMHPAKAQTAKSIENNQLKLLNALLTIMIAEDTNFNTVFKAVIALAKAHRNTTFSPTMRNRGLNSIELTTIDNNNMRFLTRIVDVLHVTAGVRDVSQVKGLIDMNKLLSSIANVKAKNNLTAFYS